MNWNQIDFDWNKAKAFWVAAEEGSFLAASRLLKVAQPTLGRQVAALEEELGVALFEKIGRSLQLTPSGLELLEQVRKMGEAANELALTASGQSTEIEGTVRISASEAYAVFILPPLLKRLRQEQPKIRLEVIASNDSSDLRRREADIALRNYQPKHEDLIAKKISDSTFSFYATPAYLKTLGPLRNKADLNRACFIGFSENDEVISQLNQQGLNLSPANFPYLVNSHLLHWELVKAGAGIGFMASCIGDRERGLEKVLPGQFPKLAIENWLVSHRDLKNSLRIRVVYDFLYQELSSRLI